MLSSGVTDHSLKWIDERLEIEREALCDVALLCAAKGVPLSDDDAVLAQDQVMEELLYAYYLLRYPEIMGQ